ncbi:MAG: phosphatidate cytidylyltransferase [Planctomycetota bacterium]
MAGSEFRTRALLTPALLIAIGAVYWLDSSAALGCRPGTLSAAVLGLLGIAGLREYIALLRGASFAVARVPLLAAGSALHAAALMFGWSRVDRELYPPVSITMLLLCYLAVRSLGRESMRTSLELQGSSLLGFLFVSWSMYLGQGICFRHLPSVLFVVLVCKSGDIGGYLAGSQFGGRKLIPHVSPGKTVKGALGSLAFSVVMAFALRPLLLAPAVELGPLSTAAVGVMLNFTTQAGDLIESLLKRRCGAKDSASLLPAHGGVLDLVDSILFSLSAWFLILIWLTGAPD